MVHEDVVVLVCTSHVGVHQRLPTSQIYGQGPPGVIGRNQPRRGVFGSVLLVGAALVPPKLGAVGPGQASAQAQPALAEVFHTPDPKGPVYKQRLPGLRLFVDVGDAVHKQGPLPLRLFVDIDHEAVYKQGLRLHLLGLYVDDAPRGQDPLPPLFLGVDDDEVYEQDQRALLLDAHDVDGDVHEQDPAPRQSSLGARVLSWEVCAEVSSVFSPP